MQRKHDSYPKRVKSNRRTRYVNRSLEHIGTRCHASSINWEGHQVYAGGGGAARGCRNLSADSRMLSFKIWGDRAKLPSTHVEIMIFLLSFTARDDQSLQVIILIIKSWHSLL